MKLLVTENHLDKALELRGVPRDSQSARPACILEIAGREYFKTADVKTGFISMATSHKRFQFVSDSLQIASLYDEGAYNELRTILPMELEFYEVTSN
jgi:hypothetical protein